MDKHNSDISEDLQPTSEPASTGQANVSWTTVLFVLLILLVGAVVGHGLLRNGSAPAKGLASDGSLPCAACPASETCQASQAGPAAKENTGIASGCTGCCPAEQSACPLAKPGCCAAKASDSVKQGDPAAPCCAE